MKTSYLRCTRYFAKTMAKSIISKTNEWRLLGSLYVVWDTFTEDIFIFRHGISIYRVHLRNFYLKYISKFNLFKLCII